MSNKKKLESLPTLTEIRKTSTKHYEIYSKVKEKDINSVHRMILFYAVECGLKGVYYETFKKEMRKKPPPKRKGEKNRYYTLPKERTEEKKAKHYDLLYHGHQIEGLIKKLKLPNMGYCPKIKLVKEPEEKHPIEDAHAYWRYGYVMEDASEKALVKWLEGVYKKLKKVGNYR